MNQILHLGLGSFHRAHQAVYLDLLHELGDTSWGLFAGNIRPDMAQTIEALIAQHGQYTLETISPRGIHTYRRVKSLKRVIAYEAGLAQMIEIGASANTKIISFTVTEAGYYLDPHNRLDPRFEDLRRDLSGGSHLTIYGAVAAILRERMARGSGPVTLLNCDNLRSNGERFRLGLLDFLARRDEAVLHAWVQTHTSCPNAMVDRITPRPAPQVAMRVKQATGWDDRAAVMAEDFIQWVIEDRFVAGRPDWPRVGAQMVDAVHPYEEAKIRILNASHSCIAWAGTLLGLTYIYEGTRVDAIRQMAQDYVIQDVIPCLSPSPIDLAQYLDVVLDRFSNGALHDTNQRVAMDGFSKIPGFIAPTLRERLADHAAIDSTATLAALYFLFLQRWSDQQLSYTYEDQAMDPAIAHAFFDAPDPVAAFCTNPILWGAMSSDRRLYEAVSNAVARLRSWLQAASRG